jgi:AcrR family transcriptional regulator
MPAPRRSTAGKRRIPKQDRARATVGYVLEAAAQVFQARGYDATTNEIAARAGVSIGTLYQYFADKDALLVALAEQHVSSARDEIRRALARTSTGDEAAFVRAVIEAAVEANRPTGLHHLLYETAPRTPELVAALEGLHEDVSAAAAGLLINRGAEPAVAHRRAHALVVALDAIIHDHVLAASSPIEGQRRIDDAVSMAMASLATWAAPSVTEDAAT